jgi:hypothetical protein
MQARTIGLPMVSRHFSIAASWERAANVGVGCPASRNAEMTHPENREARVCLRGKPEPDRNIDGNTNPPGRYEFGDISRFPGHRHKDFEPV